MHESGAWGRDRVFGGHLTRTGDTQPASTYLKAAFLFRPFGMFVAPNWIALGVAGLLGTLHPAFWALGIVGEAAYLLALASAPRFRAMVDLQHRPPDRGEETALAGLPDAARRRYAGLRATAEAILEDAPEDEPEAAQEDRARLLERMLGVYLQLLGGHATLSRARAGQDPDVPRRLAEARARLAQAADPDLRATLQDQVAVLDARVATAEEARARLAWIDAELGRIEEHVGLLRDRTLLRGDPSASAPEVDRLAELLAGADLWLREQAELTTDLPAEPSRLRGPAAKASR